MKFSDTLQTLRSISAFELYRLPAAINRVLDVDAAEQDVLATSVRNFLAHP